MGVAYMGTVLLPFFNSQYNRFLNKTFLLFFQFFYFFFIVPLL